jgi:Domain of unknown function (DUF4062)
VKIYISSTFRDLREHRAAVDRNLRSMGHDVIGMEQYVAEGGRPLQRCLADVEAADIYVLLLGWRYGYRPTECNPNHLSITELEYQHAKRLTTKPILAFLLDPETPWPPSAMDSASGDTDAAAAISRFRADVGADYIIGMYTTPDDLASRVSAAVAVQGLTSQLAERLLSRSSVRADQMEGFGTGSQLWDTRIMAIKKMVVDVGRDRALVIHLGDGDRWWSTRLFLFAHLLRSLTTVRQLVFSGRGGHFAGMASPAAIIEGFGSQFPILEEFRRRLQQENASDDREREIDRQLDIWFQFLQDVPTTTAVVKTPRPPGPAAAQPSAELTQSTLDVERTIQVGVREELLERWLGERIVTRCIRIRESQLTMAQVQQVVDSLLPDVPVEMQPATKLVTSQTIGNDVPPVPRGPDAEDPTAPLLLVVDRDAFGLAIAQEWVLAALPRNRAH